MIQCRDEHCSSAFAKQTIARQGDLPAFQQSGTLDLPAANCICSECRTSNARPYAASRKECRDAHRASAFAKQTIARQGDLPALQQSATLDLPAANCIRSECRTSNARPYAASRKGCRDAHCASADTHPRSVAAKWYVGFASGKLHSFRMPDEQCSSLRGITGRM